MTYSDYTFTALRAEVDVSNPANLPNASFENDVNKMVRALKEVQACINGTDAGNDSNGNALEDYTSNGILDRINEVDARVTDVDTRTIPLGALLPYSYTTAPSKFVLPYGQAISRSTYSAYWGLVGTTYGIGDGSSTFNVPDLRGRVVVGKDNMGGSAASRITAASTDGGNSTTLGGAIGAETHTLVTGEMPAHQHNGYYAASGNAGGAGKLVANSGSTLSNSVTSTGGDGAHSNTQPGLIQNFILYVAA